MKLFILYSKTHLQPAHIKKNQGLQRLFQNMKTMEVKKLMRGHNNSTLATSIYDFNKSVFPVSFSEKSYAVEGQWRPAKLTALA